MRTAAVLTAVFAALVLAWVSTRGTALGWHHHGSAAPPVPNPQGRVPACGTHRFRNPQGHCVRRVELHSGMLALAIGWLLKVGGVLLVAGLAWFFFRGGTERRRRDEDPPVVEPDFPVLPSVADAVNDEADDLLRVLRTGSPRNAIVACWVGLERAITSTGFAIRDGDTSSELTVRAIRHYPVDRRALRGLAALYREARFSEHPITEQMRSAAIAYLEQLRDELRPYAHDPSVPHGATP